MKKNLLSLSLAVLGLSLGAQTPRLSLYEEFTGETCPPCASTNPGLNIKLAANYAKIAAIKWQVPIPSAPTATWSLYKTNKAEIDWRFKSAAAGGYGYTPGISSAPSSKIDGQEATVFGATSGHPLYLNNTVINTAQSYTSAFSITMNRDWDATGSSINLTVTIQATAPFTAVGPLVFRTVMVERLIQFSVQPGSNGEKDFEDVAIKSFPTLQNGVAMASSWTLGQTQTFTLNCPIPTYTRKKEEVAFVGFIQDDGNQKVAQAVRAAKAPLTNDAVAIGAKVPVTCSNMIAPEITVKNNGTSTITNLTITPYTDGVAGAVTMWSGSLSSGSSTSILLNAVSTSTVSGAHTFSYNISAMNGADFNLNNNTAKVTYLVAGDYQGAPVAEGFVLGAYPPVGWTVVNPNNGPGWSRNPTYGAYALSNESTKYDFFSNTVIGDQDELYLPPIDLSGENTPQLSFDVAYAQRTFSSNDMIDIYASDDCGTTWTNVYNSAGTALTSTQPTGVSYIPTPNEWKTETVDLTGFNKANVIVKFVTTNDNGNNMYLDNINLSQSNPTGINKVNAAQMNVSLYPNPTNGITNLSINAGKANDVKITIVNTLGQVVLNKQSSLNEGANIIQIDTRDLASGVYNVTVDAKAGSIVKKLNVTK